MNCACAKASAAARVLDTVRSSVHFNVWTWTCYLSLETPCRKALHVEKQSILSEIQREIRKFNQDVVVSPGTDDHGVDQNVVFLQRYSDYWKSFINVSSVDEVAQGDKLIRIVLCYFTLEIA